jgi:hypothetical protein
VNDVHELLLLVVPLHDDPVDGLLVDAAHRHGFHVLDLSDELDAQVDVLVVDVHPAVEIVQVGAQALDVLEGVLLLPAFEGTPADLALLLVQDGQHAVDFLLELVGLHLVAGHHGVDAGLEVARGLGRGERGPGLLGDLLAGEEAFEFLEDVHGDPRTSKFQVASSKSQVPGNGAHGTHVRNVISAGS